MTLAFKLPGLLRGTFGVAVLLCLTGVPSVSGQVDDGDVHAVATRSPARAAGLSLLLPGLGHRYANHGSWKGAATVFAIADAASWVGLLRTRALRSQRIDSYQALAASRARADVTGKDRRFFLNLATYESSDEYLEIQLRNRAWDQLDYVSTPEFQWAWDSPEDFAAFRDLRDSAETLDRRTSVIIAAMVANRVVSALFAVRAANRSNRTRASITVTPPQGQTYPVLNVDVRW